MLLPLNYIQNAFFIAQLSQQSVIDFDRTKIGFKHLYFENMGFKSRKSRIYFWVFDHIMSDDDRLN